MPDLDSSFYPPTDHPDTPVDDDLRTQDARKLVNIAAVVTELAANQDLSTASQNALAELSRNLQAKSYRDRAGAAITSAGLQIPHKPVFHTAPALMNPDQSSSSEKSVVFPLTNMVKSRVVASWRSMAGLKGSEDWDPNSSVPPPNPVKVGKAIPKPKLFDTAYNMEANGILSSRPLQQEGALTAKAETPISMPVSRLQDWERVLLSSVEVINMLEIFSSSISQDNRELWTCLEKYDDLPEDLQEILARRSTLQANEESKAKALQHLTSYLSWLLAENILTKRDHVLSKTDKHLSDAAKNVLRLQPLGGPTLFNGKAEEVLKKEAEDKSASVMLKMHQMLSKKPGSATPATPSTSTFRQDKPATQTSRNEPFRGRGRGRGQGKTFRGTPRTPSSRGRGSTGRGGKGPART